MNLFLASAGLTHDQIKNKFLEEAKKLSNAQLAVLYTVKNPGDEAWLVYRQEE